VLGLVLLGATFCFFLDFSC